MSSLRQFPSRRVVPDSVRNSAGDPTSIENVIDFEDKAIEKTRLLPKVEGSSISCKLGHIFAGGYSAGYYSYKWAESLDADAFEHFKENGIFNTVIADSFRKNILEKGNTEPPMDMLLRSEVIWSKPNPFPENLQGWAWQDADEEGRDMQLSRGSWRCTEAHEPIFQFAKAMHYYGENPEASESTPNRRSVWEIPVYNAPYSHYAMFPEALLSTCILSLPFVNFVNTIMESITNKYQV